MNRLGKQILVFTMVWVLLVMVVSQVYDNFTGRGMPVREEAALAGAVSTPEPDAGVTRLAELQSCVAADPGNLQCVQELADTYYARKQWPQAQLEYERSVGLEPHDAAVLLKLAGTYIYQQKFEQAVPTLQQATTLKPDSPEIYLLLGIALSRLDPPQTEAALTAWRKVVELAPESAWAQQARQYINESSR
jgi:predicted Zn-dependent protease